MYIVIIYFTIQYKNMCRRTRNGLRITPLLKQCFAASSVILNHFSNGLSIGYNATLFLELRRTREIVLDINSESWLASLIGLTILFGSAISSIMMETVGRRPAMITSSVLMICGWISFSLASSFPILLTGKLLQGTAVGICSSLGNILIAEYSSPKHRGSLAAAAPSAMLFGIFIAHAFGMLFSWRDLSTALVFFSLPGLIVAVFSPESPSFLVNKKRYDESRKVFLWLRGTDENDELETMIRAGKILRKVKQTKIEEIKNKHKYVMSAFGKREFRIPVIIMIHLTAIFQFCGGIISDTYSVDVHTAIYGTDVYMYKVITSIDIVRLVATTSSIYISCRLKRRKMILAFISLNTLLNLSIAGYIFAKKRNLLPFDHLAIGLFLHHALYLTIGVGCVPLLAIVGGEIFPLPDKGLCLIISKIFYALFMFGNLKSAPYLFRSVGVDGVYFIAALILGYSLAVTLSLLPETKDKTLQEIEDHFRGHAVNDPEEELELNPENDVENNFEKDG